MTRTKFALMLALIVVLAAILGWPAKDEATPAALHFGEAESVSRGASGRDSDPQAGELALQASGESSREVASEILGGDGFAASASKLANLHVRVLGENGPEVACRVTLWRSEFDFETALCDDEGQCTVEGLEPGVVWKVDLIDPAFLKTTHEEPLTLAAGERREVVYFLGEGLELTGTLKDEEGRPVAQHEVRMRRREVFTDVGDLADMSTAEARVVAVTDEGGEYRFEYIGRGNWWIWPAAREGSVGAAPPELGLALNLPAGISRYRQPLVMNSPRSIQGMVLGADGTAARWLHVAARSVGGLEWQAFAETDELGEFQLQGLPPGDFELVAQDFFDSPTSGRTTGSLRDLGPGSNSQRSKPRRVSAGTQGVVLKLRDFEAASATLRGQLVAKETELELAGGITLRSAGQRVRGYMPPIEARDDGSFEATSLDPGSYILSAHGPNGALLSTPIELDLSSLEELDLGKIKLYEAVPVQVDIVGAKERGTLQVLWMGQHFESQTTAIGVPYRLSLPRGRFKLSWRSSRELPVNVVLDTTSGVEQRVTIQSR